MRILTLLLTFVFIISCASNNNSLSLIEKRDGIFKLDKKAIVIIEIHDGDDPDMLRNMIFNDLKDHGIEVMESVSISKSVKNKINDVDLSYFNRVATHIIEAKLLISPSKYICESNQQCIKGSADLDLVVKDLKKGTILYSDRLSSFRNLGSILEKSSLNSTEVLTSSLLKDLKTQLSFQLFGGNVYKDVPYVTYGDNPNFNIAFSHLSNKEYSKAIDLLNTTLESSNDAKTREALTINLITANLLSGKKEVAKKIFGETDANSFEEEYFLLAKILR